MAGPKAAASAGLFATGGPVAAAAPYALDFITGLFGGKKRGESPEAIFQRNYTKYLAMLPKLDTKGIYSRSLAGYDQSARINDAQRNMRFRQLLGPNAYSANEAAGAGANVANRSKFAFGAASDVSQLGFNSELQRANTAAGIAGGITGAQQDYSTQRNLFDRSAGLVASGASNRLDQAQTIAFLQKMGLFSKNA